MSKRFTSFVNLLCLLLLIFSAKNAVVASFLGSSEPLVDWLDRLQIKIPDQSFSAQFLTIQLRNVSCTHFNISHIDSVYESAVPSAPQIHFTVREVAASCSGVYQGSGGIHGILSAQLAVGGEDNTSNSTNALEWTLQVLDDETNADTSMRMPGSIQSLYCTTHIACTGLHFAGSSISAKLLELFHDVIIHAVNHAVRDQICPVLQPRADALLSSYLQAALHWLRPYLRPPLPPLIDENTAYAATSMQLGTLGVNDDAVVADVWSRNLLFMKEDEDGDDDNYILDFDTDLPNLMGILHNVNNFIDTHLRHGFLPHDLLCNASCGGFFDGINGLLRLALPDTFTISVGSWIPAIDFILPHYAAVELTIQNITLTGAGLSEWISLQVLRPVDDSSSGNTTQFRTHLETQSNFSIAVALTLRVQDVPGGIFHGDALVESFVVHVNITRFLASVDLSMQLRRRFLERITVGMLTVWNHDLDCVLQAIQRMEVSKLIGAMCLSRIFIEPIPEGVYKDAYINQQLEFDIDHLINTILKLVVSEYEEMTTTAIGGWIRSLSFQNQINHYIAQSVVPSNIEDCNNTSTPSDISDRNRTGQWFNFTRFELLHRLNAYLNLSGTIEKLNPYLDCTTNVFKNALHQQFVHPIFDSSNQSVAQLVDLDIHGADNVQQLEFLLPSSTDGLHLDSSLIWVSAETEVRPHIFLSLNVYYAPLNVSAMVNLTIIVDDIHVAGGAVFPFDVGQFRQMSFLKLLSSAQCALIPVDKADLHIYESENKLGFFEIIVNASLTLLGQNDTMDIAFHSNDFPGAESYASSVFDWSVGTCVDLMEAFAKVFLTVNSNQCSGESSDSQSSWSDPNALPMKPLFLILFSVFLFLQPAVLFVKRSREVSSNSRSDQNATRLVESIEPLLHPRYRGDELNEEHSIINRTVVPSCFMLDNSIAEVARHVILLSIVVTLILLFVSNISVGATVEVLVSGANGSPLLQLPPMFAFGLLNTANDMLKARIYPLFFLVVVFSGIWPYMKLLLMLFSWIGSKSMLCDDKRGELLFKLDALSKFSLVDTYVLIGTSLDQRRCSFAVLSKYKTYTFSITFVSSDACRISISFAFDQRIIVGCICIAPVWFLRLLTGHNVFSDHRTCFAIFTSICQHFGKFTCTRG
jgi:hypothetical protein